MVAGADAGQGRHGEYMRNGKTQGVVGSDINIRRPRHSKENMQADTGVSGDVGARH